MSGFQPGDSSLDVVTPERVSFSVPVAGIGSRGLAYGVDFAILFFGWVALYFLFTLLTSDVLRVLRGLSGLTTALLFLSVFFAQWMYWTLSEVLLNGQTLGKRVAGVRVVREDGAPVTFFESAVRNLLRAVDFLPAGYAVGILSILITRRQQRLGDILAGTLLMREERINLDQYAVAPGARTDVNPLTSEDSELIFKFLEREEGLDPTSSTRLLGQLLERFAPLERRTELLRDRTQALAYLRALAGGGG